MPSSTSKTPDTRDPKGCLDRLASLRRGELAALATYRQAMAKDEAPAAGLAAIRGDHEDAAAALASRIEALGGAAAATAGAWGDVTKVVEAAAKVFGNVAATTALRLGEEHGAAKYEEALTDEALDSATKDLIVSTLLPRQHAH